MNNNQVMAKVNQYKTSHVLHLILSILSAGVWVPVWMLVTISNALERARLIRKLL